MTMDPQKHATLLAHYHEVSEDFRQMDALVWQVIPPLAVTIGGTLVVVTYSLLGKAPLFVQELVLGIALQLTIGINFIMLRHRYFQSIAVGTLARLEKELETGHVQRTPFPRKYDKKSAYKLLYPNGLFYPRKPNFILDDGTPGPTLMFWFLTIVSIGIILGMVFNYARFFHSVNAINNVWAAVTGALFIASAIGMPLLVKYREASSTSKEKEANEYGETL
jgi:hypothetical protein